MGLFSGINYEEYAEEFDFYSLLGIDKESYGDVSAKKTHPADYGVDNSTIE